MKKIVGLMIILGILLSYNISLFGSNLSYNEINNFGKYQIILDNFISKIKISRKDYKTQKEYILSLNKIEKQLNNVKKKYSKNKDILKMIDYLSFEIIKIKNNILDINKIFTIGHSQGAYIVTLLNTLQKVDGVISNSPGPINLQILCERVEKNSASIDSTRIYKSDVKIQTINFFGDYDFNLVHKGLTRSYKVHIPANYKKENKTALLLALHGGGGSAEAGPKFFGLNAKADKEGFIVVYPQGTGKKILGKSFGVWNAGECCGLAVKNNVDDVGFIDALIEKLKIDYRIDEKKVYVTGMSNGAQMSYRLACELSDKIAAIAPSGSEGRFQTCVPKRSVPTLHIQGKKDPCSLYDGGVCGKCLSDFGKKIGISEVYGEWSCLSMHNYMDKWRKINTCSSELKTIFQSKGVVCESYGDCPQNAEVILCSIDNLGHNWAGQSSYGIDACDKNPNGVICNLWKKSVGPLSQELSANNYMWEFFKKHPLP